MAGLLPAAVGQFLYPGLVGYYQSFLRFREGHEEGLRPAGAAALEVLDADEVGFVAAAIPLKAYLDDGARLVHQFRAQVPPGLAGARVFVDQAEEGNIVGVDGLVHQVDAFERVVGAVKVADAVGGHIEHHQQVVGEGLPHVVQVLRQDREAFLAGNVQQCPLTGPFRCPDR